MLPVILNLFNIWIKMFIIIEQYQYYFFLLLSYRDETVFIIKK